MISKIHVIPAGRADRFIVAIFNNDEKTPKPILSHTEFVGCYLPIPVNHLLSKLLPTKN